MTINNKLPQLTTMSKEEINKRFDGIANPNIIANGDFVNLVNTTGKKEFVKVKDGYVPIFDGWLLTGGNNNFVKVTVQDDGVLIDSGTPENGAQIAYDLSISDSVQLSEKVVTLSREYVNIGNTNSSFSIQILKNGIIVKGLENAYSNVHVFRIPKLNDGEYIRVVLMLGSKNGEILKALFKKVKLELGDKATPLGYVSQAQKQLETDGVPLLYGGNLLLQGTDLNNVTNIGNYYCNSDLLSAMIRNAPTQKAFTLKVESAVGETIVGLDQYPRQTITDTESTIYMRQGFINTAGEVSWKEWKKFADITTATQLSTIETLVRKSNQDIIDEYTLELIESGVIK